jgi:hypothetical protein
MQYHPITVNETGTIVTHLEILPRVEITDRSRRQNSKLPTKLTWPVQPVIPPANFLPIRAAAGNSIYFITLSENLSILQSSSI